MATPKMNRRKEVDLGSVPTLGPDLERDYDAQTIPASSIPRIPQSAARFARSSGSSSVCKATPAHPGPERTFTSAIQGTPCRGSTQSQLSDSFDKKSFNVYSAIPPSSPLQSRPQIKHQMLTVPRPLAEEMDNFCTPSRPGKIQVTPVKQGTLRNIENEDPFQIVISTPVPTASKIGGVGHIRKIESSIVNTDSIYKSLGWDDFDDF